MASMALIAPSAVDVRTTGTMPISVMKERICCLVMILRYPLCTVNSFFRESVGTDLVTPGGSQRAAQWGWALKSRICRLYGDVILFHRVKELQLCVSLRNPCSVSLWRSRCSA